MTKLEIEKCNKLMAEFMGLRFIGNGWVDQYWIDGNYVCVELKYHLSWDRIMPVIENIESIYDSFHGHFGVYISSNSCTIQGTKLNTSIDNPHYAYFNSEYGVTKIMATYSAVINFIKWHNNHINRQGE